jgi:hypothetical protein
LGALASLGSLRALTTFAGAETGAEEAGAGVEAEAVAEAGVLVVLAMVVGLYPL